LDREAQAVGVAAVLLDQGVVSIVEEEEALQLGMCGRTRKAAVAGHLLVAEELEWHTPTAAPPAVSSSGTGRLSANFRTDIPQPPRSPPGHRSTP
jgi:hypothetical protein